MKRTIRFKITDYSGLNIYYLTLGPGGINFFNKHEVPLALSYILTDHNAVEFRFALEDALEHACDGSKSGRSVIVDKMAIAAIERFLKGKVMSVEYMSPRALDVGTSMAQVLLRV